MTDENTVYVLAIDLGTGGPKAALVSDRGEVIAGTTEPIETLLLPEGGAEQDPADWWEMSIKAAKHVINQAGIPPERIVCVSCDSQYSVIVPVDKDGRHLMNAVHWWDSRGTRYCDQIRKGFPSIEGFGVRKLRKWVRKVGMVPLGSGVSIGHILFIKHERTEVYDKTCAFLEPVDYLTSRLTGRVTASQQTMPMTCVVANDTWSRDDYDHELLKMAGLERDKFPELVPNNGIIGPLREEVARELGLRPSTPVTAGLWDTHGNALGAGIAKDFEPIIYIGTSLVVTFLVPYKKTSILKSMTTTPCPIESKYMHFGELGLGGKCVDFFLKNFVFNSGDDSDSLPEEAYEQFNRMASDAPAGSGGVLFLPWLNGSLVPLPDENARGGFINLNLKTTRSHMARAVMEGLAFQTRWALDAIQKFCGRTFDHYRFIGGGALSDTWSQIFADVLGSRVMQIDDPRNATVRGTAFVGLYNLGLRRPEEFVDMVRVKKVYEPEASNRAVYDRVYPQYVEFFKRNKTFFRALNAH